MIEIWKDIKGYEGLYQVSSLGKVKSLDRIGKSRNNGNRLFLGQELKYYIQKTTNNYYKIRVTLRKNSKPYKYFVSILVAKAFPEICGEWFEGAEVHHKDGNPLNNTSENLIVCTKEQHKEFHRIMGKGLGNKNPFFGKHHSSKTKHIISKKNRKPIIQCDKEGNELLGWFSETDVEIELGYSHIQISKCVTGKTKTSYGFKWKRAPIIQ